MVPAPGVGPSTPPPSVERCFDEREECRVAHGSVAHGCNVARVLCCDAWRARAQRERDRRERAPARRIGVRDLIKLLSACRWFILK